MFGWAVPAGLAELVCGIGAWIYSGPAPGVALLAAGLVFLVVAWNGDRLPA